jgi:hypothetical protein
VLKPGGRFAVSDVVVRGEVPADIRRGVELWIGCVAGALDEADYRARLLKAGFESVEKAGVDTDAIAPAVEGTFMSASIRGRKPLR